MTFTPRPGRTGLTTLSLGVALVALTAGCGSAGGQAQAPTRTDMARYVQTWGTDYDHTTCRQWTAQMSDQQRWTAAFEMLRDDRSNDQAISILPADALVDRFKADLDTRCGGKEAVDTAVSDIASDAYLAARSGYRK